MNKSVKGVLALTLWIAGNTLVCAQDVIEEFQLEGLISPASPKALTAALETQLAVKVLGYDMRDTHTGWPVVRVAFDEGSVDRAQIEAVIDTTEDPTGRKFKVHTGPPVLNVALLEEETEANGALGDAFVESPTLINPVEASSESLTRGKGLYDEKCTKCHGANGDGTGPSTHGISENPRKLWIWGSTGDATDGYLFAFITNGRTDMPPWELVLSETDRWDLVNYIKTLKPPH